MSLYDHNSLLASGNRSCSRIRGFVSSETEQAGKAGPTLGPRRLRVRNPNLRHLRGPIAKSLAAETALERGNTARAKSAGQQTEETMLFVSWGFAVSLGFAWPVQILATRTETKLNAIVLKTSDFLRRHAATNGLDFTPKIFSKGRMT
jgi:hypothetical protein